MFRVAALLVLLHLLLAALALISCLSVEDKRQIRGVPRLAWVVAILLVPLAGPIAWFLLGRPRPAGATGARPRRPGGGVLPEPPRTRAPDDDPEFLRSLDQPALNNEDERLLRQWEEDLRRREDEQRRRDPGADG
jgi:hypothetical protein